MAHVRVETLIQAPLELCFDLARDVDVHVKTSFRTRERAVAGVTSGKMGPGDSVTFEAVHFGIRQRLTARITDFDPPDLFVDEMERGAFKRMRHEHHFLSSDAGTLMVDVLDFRSPFGPLGWLVDIFVLRVYMRKFLSRRGKELKLIAEQTENREP